MCVHAHPLSQVCVCVCVHTSFRPLRGSRFSCNTKTYPLCPIRPMFRPYLNPYWLCGPAKITIYKQYPTCLYICNPGIKSTSQGSFENYVEQNVWSLNIALSMLRWQPITNTGLWILFKMKFFFSNKPFSASDIWNKKKIKTINSLLPLFFSHLEWFKFYIKDSFIDVWVIYCQIHHLHTFQWFLVHLQNCAAILEKRMTTHSSLIAWIIPWTEELI